MLQDILIGIQTGGEQMIRLDIKTSSRTHFCEVTTHVADVVRDLGMSDGIITVYVPHTTAGVTINENADPDVVADMSDALDRAVPW
jgi:secondary thiamine-phosphate synthase enzyme